MLIHVPCLCPFGLAIKLSFNNPKEPVGQEESLGVSFYMVTAKLKWRCERKGKTVMIISDENSFYYRKLVKLYIISSVISIQAIQ